MIPLTFQSVLKEFVTLIGFAVSHSVHCGRYFTLTLNTFFKSKCILRFDWLKLISFLSMNLNVNEEFVNLYDVLK